MQTYSLSFTTCSLRKQQALQVANTYLRYRDWEAARNELITRNGLQQRTTISTRKLCQELSSRLKHLSAAELNFLSESSHSEQHIILWVAICRRYPFIRNFSREVIVGHRQRLFSRVTNADFEAFFNSKLGVNSELSQVSIATRHKARQVVFNMLREVGLLNNQNMLCIIVPSFETQTIVKRQELEAIGFLCTREPALSNSG